MCAVFGEIRTMKKIIMIIDRPCVGWRPTLITCSASNLSFLVYYLHSLTSNVITVITFKTIFRIMKYHPVYTGLTNMPYRHKDRLECSIGKLIGNVPIDSGDIPFSITWSSLISYHVLINP